MVEPSTTSRLVATLFVALLSLAVWRWFQTSASTRPATSPSTGDRKKTKKKTKKKKTKTDPSTANTNESNPSSNQPSKGKGDSAASSAPASDSDEESDEDAGLTAKQILAKRRFKPKAIGGLAAPPAAANSNLIKFQVNQRIVARYQNGREWFPGVITEVRRGNEYHIQYDDGAFEYHVPYALIKDAAAYEKETEKRTQRTAKRTTESNVAKASSSSRLNVVDSGRSEAEADDEAEATGSGDVDTGSDDDAADQGEGEVDAGEDSEDGWQVVSSAAKKRSSTASAAAVAEEDKVDADGLTKRQRENRRKNERKKEKKELVRAQAQENGLHARWGGTMTRLKYVPPPPPHGGV